TKEMEGNKHPQVHQVIPLMDEIYKILETHRDNIFLDSRLRFAAQKGITLLNKYYAKTDDSLIYRSAMLLHPSYKTSYFTQEEWPDDWITTAKEALKTFWETYYKPKSKPPPQPTKD
ncbi:hypothetical protein K435DRAFT_623170, partial [Dendrothele bispora CBS 962.96]